MTPFSVPSFDVGIDELVDWTPEWLSSNIGALNVESANVSVVWASELGSEFIELV